MKIYLYKFNYYEHLKKSWVLFLCFSSIFGAPPQKDICQFLGGRADKNFLGSGNVALVSETNMAKVLFVQKWTTNGLFDWASGSVENWYPDRMKMKESVPAKGMSTNISPISRTIFITRNDVLGTQWIWKNDTDKDLIVQVNITGKLPGKPLFNNTKQRILLTSSAPYSEKVSDSIHYVLTSSVTPENTFIDHDNYTLKFNLKLKPKTQKSFHLLLGIGTNFGQTEKYVNQWKNKPAILEAVRKNWNQWFFEEIPIFECSDPYFEKLYYYRWWSLYTKMIFARLGHFYHPSPREGTVMYEGVVSYSGSCISIDELRWMRNPDWAFSTTKEFFHPKNLNDGYLSNHIWDWGIDGDSSNMNTLGRSFPYQNYAIDAFRSALWVHPEKGKQALQEVWPQMLTHLQSYERFYDIDKDGLYETYPWSNTAGQEWSIRFSYFDPIPELFRYERGRTYAPDGTQKMEDMALLEKIKTAVKTDSALSWPKTSEALYKTYYDSFDHRLATVDQSTYAFMNFDAATDLAGIINDNAAKNHFEQLKNVTKNKILFTLWDSEDFYFYDAKPITHQLAKVKASTGFYVFWAHLAQKEHLPMLNYLFDPEVFYTNYPVPSLPLNYEFYDELQKTGWNYWNYYTWPRTTCHVVDGALWAAKNLDKSLSDKAARLFDKYTRMHFPKEDVTIPNIAERYDPHSGEAFMDQLDYNHSSWIDLLIKHVAGLTPNDSEIITLDPIDMGWDSFSFKNLFYQNHNISIDFSRKSGTTIRVDGIIRATSPTLKKVDILLNQKK